jgi:outer membrane protein
VLNARCFLNLDVKKVWINTDVTVDGTANRGAVVKADFDISPAIFGVGIGERY